MFESSYHWYPYIVYILVIKPATLANRFQPITSQESGEGVLMPILTKVRPAIYIFIA